MERDKVDKAAVGFDYKSRAEKHDSQKGEPGAPCSGRARTAVRDRAAGLRDTALRVRSLLRGWWGSCWVPAACSRGRGGWESHGCWKKCGLNEEEPICVGTGISWAACHQRKGAGKSQAGANSRWHVQGGGRAVCSHQWGNPAFLHIFLQVFSRENHCPCMISLSLPCLFSSVP